MNSSKRIFYFDALRAFAILCVILLHITGHLGELMNYNISTIYSFSGVFETFMNNFTRIGVDLFLMISGALLLGRQWDIKGFFKKRIPRIAVPFLFWSLIFTAVLVISSFLSSDLRFVNDFSVSGLFGLFLNTLFFRAPGSVVYWFFWMMLYVYLLMPFLNKWIVNTQKCNLEYLLVIWMVFITIIYPLNNQYLVLASDFISPISLVILGYYLRYNKGKILNNPYVSAILIIIVSLAMLMYSYNVVNTTILFVFHRYSLPVVLVAAGVFCLFKNTESISNASGKTSEVMSSIAVCSYGMYLIHSQMIMAARKIFHLSSNFIFDYLLLFIVGFVLSWIIILVLAKIPIINELIGVK